MNHAKKTLLAAAVFASAPAFAEDAMSAKPGVPSLAEVMGASGISVSGYIDTSYTHLSGTGKFNDTSTTPNRVYDRESESFNLNMLDLTISSLPSNGFGGLVDINFGSDADVNASTGTGSGDQTDVQAAYVHYVNGPLMIIGGKFVTLAGAEVIKSPANLNFSRSILFGYAIPFSHTGARLTYTVNDKLALVAGVNNGWDVVKESASTDKKTVELGVSTTPVAGLTVAASYYSGKETGAAVGNRTLLDVVASYSATDALSFVLNYDSGSQQDAVSIGSDAKWSGLAGYVNYKLNDQWRIAVRAENFDDKDGYRTNTVQKWKEYTATLAYAPTDKVELRGELRSDKSDKNVFAQSDGTAKDKQDSVGLEAIYKF